MLDYRPIVTAAAIAGLAVSALSSLKLGWADFEVRKQTAAATQAALRWTPDQEEYYLRLASLTVDDDPPASLAALQRATELNPSDANSWIELGLRLEESGRFADAEHYLLRAASEDRQFLPRWTLANYYFRRGDTARFLVWAKSAAEMVYGDATPLFRLCGSLGEDGRLLDRLQILRPDVRAGYLSYLVTADRVDVIMPAARTVVAEGRDADVPVLLAACDRLLEKARSRDALEIWNRLAATRRIPFALLDPEGGQALTNGHFLEAPTSRGFDWRLIPAPGVTAAMEDGGGIRFTFSGVQAENCEVLSQWIPTRENTDYELKIGYRTSDIPPGSGLLWHIADASGGRTLLATGSLSSEDAQWCHYRLRTPPGCRLARLALSYRRAGGTTRIAGHIVVRGLELRRIS